jgi:hypothetical protein
VGIVGVSMFPLRAGVCGRSAPSQPLHPLSQVKGPVKKSSAEQNAAYIAGLCIDCRAVGYSAGRPRCSNCHAAYVGRAAQL